MHSMATTKRRPPGQIRDAILDYLASLQGGDASVAEIYHAVQEVLDGEVPRSSVRSYLQLGAGIERVSRGRYRCLRS